MFGETEKGLVHNKFIKSFLVDIYKRTFNQNDKLDY